MMGERKSIAITARMDGLRVIAKSHGGMKKVSEMELLALCNFAELGFLMLGSQLGTKVSDEAEANAQALIEAMRVFFGKDGEPDGLTRLYALVAALLRGERLGRYVIPYNASEE